jgi:hypothetical protein
MSQPTHSAHHVNPAANHRPTAKTYQLRIQLWSGTVLTADIPADLDTADQWRAVVKASDEVASVSVVQLVDEDEEGQQ